MNGVGIFFIVLLVLLVVAAVGWIAFTQLRARRLGLPAPSFSSYNPFARSDPSPYGASGPSSGGIRGWFNDKFRPRNQRSAAGAYEQTGGFNGGGGGGSNTNNNTRSRGGFGALDPDDAWDTRVGGHEADAYGGYYEEQELGGGGGGNPYSGGGYAMNLTSTGRAHDDGYHHDDEPPRGRSRSRDGRSSQLRAGQNPFDDAAEPSNISLRGVSPRPIDTAAASRVRHNGPPSDSPTERRSVFREDV